jgi:hypothetical protein
LRLGVRVGYGVLGLVHLVEDKDAVKARAAAPLQ